MARMWNKEPNQRGVAAVEFALTVPLFLMLLGGMLALGIALYTKFIVLNAANSSVRACVISQAGQSTTAAFTGCAKQTFDSVIGAGSGLPFLCSGVSSQANDTILSTMPIDTRNSVHLLSISVRCNINVMPLMNMGKTVDTTPMGITAYAAMPYTFK